MGVSKRKRQFWAKSGVRAYFTTTSSTLVSFAITTPLLILYNFGLMMPDAREKNRVDLLTSFVLDHIGLKGFLAINGVLLFLSFVALAFAIVKKLFSFKYWGLLVIEGIFYGLLLGLSVSYLTSHAISVSLGAREPQYTVMQALCVSAGAGYWEELVFRVLCVGSFVFLSSRLFPEPTKTAKMKRVLVIAFAVATSSIAFSLAHFIEADRFALYPFVYRTLAGVVFSLIYVVRGFAVVAYTHFLYDIFVLL